MGFAQGTLCDQTGVCADNGLEGASTEAGVS